MIRSFWLRRVLEPLLGLASLEMTAEALALCIALGIVLGLIPAPGCATLLCALAALRLRLSLAAIQTVNYLVYPLQLALVVPFVRLGDLLFRRTQIPGLLGVLATTLHAVAAWFCVAVPLGFVLYWILGRVLRRCNERRRLEEAIAR